MAGPSALWNGGRSRPPRHHPSGVARSDAARYFGTNPSGEAMRRETSSADRLSAQSWANAAAALIIAALLPTATRSEEHTSELQSLMRISYAVFCLKKKKKKISKTHLLVETTNNTNK